MASISPSTKAPAVPAGRKNPALLRGGADGLGRAPVDATFYRRHLKHWLDRIAAVVLLVMLWPLLALIAAGVRFALGPGVIFRQRRVGLHGEVFTILKFRTMTPGPVAPLGVAGRERWVDYQTDRELRHTPAGRWLRKTSLDELPQLVNVVRGEMSLVGPRPELVEIVEDFDLWGHPRHLVRPGITGVWQVSPGRSGPLHEAVDTDLAYVSDVSFRGDLTVLRETIRTLTQRTGR